MITRRPYNELNPTARLLEWKRYYNGAYVAKLVDDQEERALVNGMIILRRSEIEREDDYRDHIFVKTYRGHYYIAYKKDQIM